MPPFHFRQLSMLSLIYAAAITPPLLPLLIFAFSYLLPCRYATLLRLATPRRYAFYCYVVVAMLLMPLR